MHNIRFKMFWIPGNIHSQPKDTVVERKLYEKLKALNKYQRRHGVEAIMYKKYLEKRQKVSALHIAEKFKCCKFGWAAILIGHFDCPSISFD